jgi:hypothetical protein
MSCKKVDYIAFKKSIFFFILYVIATTLCIPRRDSISRPLTQLCRNVDDLIDMHYPFTSKTKKAHVKGSFTHSSWNVVFFLSWTGLSSAQVVYFLQKKGPSVAKSSSNKQPFKKMSTNSKKIQNFSPEQFLWGPCHCIPTCIHIVFQFRRLWPKAHSQ